MRPRSTRIRGRASPRRGVRFSRLRPVLTDSRRLLYLLQITSAAFPTGGFAHSYGFETLVDEGEIVDAASLEKHAALWLRYSLAPLDGAAAGLARSAGAADDHETLAAIDELVDAIRLPREGLEASKKTGAAFLRAACGAFGGPHLRLYDRALRQGSRGTNAATVFGVAAADARLGLEDAVTAFLWSSYANLIGVTARLVPLGQLDVQRLLARSHDQVLAATRIALERGMAEISSSTAHLDVASMRHERLYSRLCIS